MARINYQDYVLQYGEPTKKGARSGIYPCFYCGVPCETIDHFIPQSYVEILKKMYLSDENERKDTRTKVLLSQKLIPACKDCNSRASDGVFDTPDEKKSFVKAKLIKRYERELLLPDWGKEEIKELNYELQESVKWAKSNQKIIQERIKW